MRICLLYTLSLVLFCVPLAAQNIDPYWRNGNASKESCNCNTLTTEGNYQTGSIWNKNKIDLRQSFDYKFNVFLGSKDTDGADGIAFVLQNISLSIGTTGEGMGFSGVTPSIGILLDTYQNGNHTDPDYDHISINRDGDVSHISTNNLAGPVTAVSGANNIEDGQWHTFRVIWDVPTKTIAAHIDGVERVKTTLDLIPQVFGNDPMVFWGFTAATGGLNNRQRICTSLNPGFSFDMNQSTCFPATIAFKDNSLSFGSIVKWYWNFGDGTIDSVQAPDPHTFPQPGIYDVKLSILGNDGCISESYNTKVTIGSKPVADFSPPPPPYCNEEMVPFTDASKVEFGTVNRWEWTVDNAVPAVKNSPGLQQTYSYGPHTVSLVVKTKEGCVSDPVTKSFSMFPSPKVDLTVADACFKTRVLFTGQSLTAAIPIRQWYWQPGDGTLDSSSSIEHVYSKGGDYEVKLVAMADNGCPSEPAVKKVKIYETHAFAGNDTVVTANYPLPLNGSGGMLYKWSPAGGLSDPTIANPVAQISKSTYYILTAYTPIGCETTDTINIRAIKGPAIYVPNAFSPNGDNKNERFRMTSVGMTDIFFFRIYNRYGQVVYNSKSTSEGWDGTINGQAQPSGTYVWVVKGKDFTGQFHEQRGTLTLIR
ncbi:PKD domain-containing protein [Paraflavitalea sp. CAU 1676]|uniref:lectin-like domain-containing protein n=1 Tax=Paraflavitalea sp. CAU 1676 TaxID=3032598 RepID=UPI0023DB269B|nr:PKD domain-containing protein [Paraflavitalea sp. CAU 1676]MDF2187119.1 PKD domain-containing protein [Paraflavitalea sp. CAU 1676]